MFRLNALWDSLPKCGFSRNHQFDPRLNGVEYVTKCLSGSALRDGLGGDFYEGSKFALRGSDSDPRLQLLMLVLERVTNNGRLNLQWILQ